MRTSRASEPEDPSLRYDGTHTNASKVLQQAAGGKLEGSGGVYYYYSEENWQRCEKDWMLRTSQSPWVGRHVLKATAVGASGAMLDKGLRRLVISLSVVFRRPVVHTASESATVSANKLTVHIHLRWTLATGVYCLTHPSWTCLAVCTEHCTLVQAAAGSRRSLTVVSRQT